MGSSFGRGGLGGGEKTGKLCNWQLAGLGCSSRKILYHSCASKTFVTSEDAVALSEPVWSPVHATILEDLEYMLFTIPVHSGNPDRIWMQIGTECHARPSRHRLPSAPMCGIQPLPVAASCRTRNQSRKQESRRTIPHSTQETTARAHESGLLEVACIQTYHILPDLPQNHMAYRSLPELACHRQALNQQFPAASIASTICSQLARCRRT